jgi:hypothetical protein
MTPSEPITAVIRALKNLRKSKKATSS